MKQCPTCQRKFPDELNFCLNDGAVLLAAQEQETTLEYPTFLQHGAHRPVVADQSPKSRLGVMLGATGLILVILLVASVKIGTWWVAREDRAAAENVNSAPRYFVAEPSATPTAAPSSSLPGPAVTTPTETALSPGTYQCEFNRTLKFGDIERPSTLKAQFTFNADMTYLKQGYATVHGTALKDQLTVEEKGTYSQSDGSLFMQGRLEREVDPERSAWTSWRVPKDGNEVTEKIRNITAATFQLFDADEKAWFTFTKL